MEAESRGDAKPPPAPPLPALLQRVGGGAAAAAVAAMVVSAAVVAAACPSSKWATQKRLAAVACPALAALAAAAASEAERPPGLTWTRLGTVPPLSPAGRMLLSRTGADEPRGMMLGVMAEQRRWRWRGWRRRW